MRSPPALYLWRGYYPKYKVSRTFIPAYYYVDNNGNAIVSDSIEGIIVRSPMTTHQQLPAKQPGARRQLNALDFDITKKIDQAFCRNRDNSAAVTFTVEWRDRAQALRISQAVSISYPRLAENTDAER